MADPGKGAFGWRWWYDNKRYNVGESGWW
jgi:hypothetical protein